MDFFFLPIDLVKIPIEAINPFCALVLLSSFEEYFSFCKFSTWIERSEKMLFARVAGQLWSFSKCIRFVFISYGLSVLPDRP